MAAVQFGRVQADPFGNMLEGRRSAQRDVYDAVLKQAQLRSMRERTAIARESMALRRQMEGQRMTLQREQMDLQRQMRGDQSEVARANADLIRSRQRAVDQATRQAQERQPHQARVDALDLQNCEAIVGANRGLAAEREARAKARSQPPPDIGARLPPLTAPPAAGPPPATRSGAGQGGGEPDAAPAGNLPSGRRGTMSRGVIREADPMQDDSGGGDVEMIPMLDGGDDEFAFEDLLE